MSRSGPVRRFECADYFGSPLAENDYWDESSQHESIWPADRVYEDSDFESLAVGGPGVDGKTWGYRSGHSGLWAWFPIDGEFVALSPTAEALMQGLLSRAIKV